MNLIINYLKKIDWVLIVAALLLTSMGLLSLYGYASHRNNFFRFKKQLFFVAVSLIVMFLASLLDWGILKDNSHFILISYLLCCFLLFGLFFVGTIREVKSWYQIGFFSFDPIEPMKIILIFLLAKFFSSRHAEMYRIIHIIISGVYVALPCFLIFLQPDFGPILVFILLWAGFLFVSGIQLRHFFILVLFFLLIFSLIWMVFLKDYQKNRIKDFLVPHLSDPLDLGWNRRQLEITIGSGGLFGQGVGQGSQTQYGFLPEPETDFIFASLAEETGLIGIMFLFSVFSVLIWRAVKIAIESKFNFYRFTAIGFAILVLGQLFVNIGVSVGFLPITGIPLPFVSYGGSGLIIFFIGVGILQSIKIHNN